MKYGIQSPCRDHKSCNSFWLHQVHNHLAKLLVLGFLAGAYIAFGALLSEIVAGGLSNGTITAAYGTIWKIALPGGLVKFAAGAVFPVGLMLVVIAGAELFTGNCMFVPISLFNRSPDSKD